MKPPRPLPGASAVLLLFAVLPTATTLPAAPGDEHWDRTFGGPGPTNVVYAMTLKGEKVYASGYWSAGPVQTNTWVEVWTGARWSAVPGVISGSMPVFDCLFVGDNLYVAGWFSLADGRRAVGLARWDGLIWSSIGDVMGLAVTLATDGVNLYVGGMFTNVGGVALTNVAKWDGTQWSGLGSGLGVDGLATWTSYVYALEWHDGSLYAGGAFTNSGGQTVRNLARWDGANWSEVGGGTDRPVYAFAFDGADLYVGGNFTTAGGVVAKSIARWNGSAWSPLGSGLIAPPPSGPVVFYSPVLALGVSGTNLIAGGSFTNAGGVRATRIARWDGSAWYSMGAMNDGIQRLRVRGTNVYIGGAFTQADDIIVNHLAVWDGTGFHALGRAGRSEGAVFPGVRAVAMGGGKVYAGGLFTGIGQVKASRIACWDGTNWSALGSGVLGTNTGSGTAVNAIAVAANGDVYAGGVFTNAGGVSAVNVARWDGINWWPLGDGIPGSVAAVAVRNNEVFVGGTFTKTTPSGTAFNLARWDGSSWWSLPGGAFAGTVGNFFVNAIAVTPGDVYAGGSFFTGNFITGERGTNIARHNGADWFALGGSVNSNVNAIVVRGTDVYVGGRFSSAGGVPASRIAKWNGSSWSALGSGVSGTGSFFVSALADLSSSLVVGGNFSNAGGLDVNRLARWDGANWSALGSGLSRSSGSPSVASLAGSWPNLWVGGNFEAAGGKPSFYLAHWNELTSFDFEPTLRLSKPGYFPDLFHGLFQCSVTATGVPAYVVEGSTNFRDWEPLLTNTLSGRHPDLDPRRFAQHGPISQGRAPSGRLLAARRGLEPRCARLTGDSTPSRSFAPGLHQAPEPAREGCVPPQPHPAQGTSRTRRTPSLPDLNQRSPLRVLGASCSPAFAPRLSTSPCRPVKTELDHRTLDARVAQTDVMT